jgi:hypothetical protein
MATYYLDTSALVKLYVTEPGSAWVDLVVTARSPDGQAAHVVALSRLAIVELAAAVSRRARLGQLDTGDRDRLVATFLADCTRRFFTLAVLDDQIRLAASLAQRQPLRGYDAMHLATALVLHRHLLDAGLEGVTFVSADASLCAAARAEGLQAEDPAAHATPADLA